MSDDPTASPAEDPAIPTPAEPPAAPAQETDWKAEARKWEARAKANADAAARAADLETKAALLPDLEAKVKEYETRDQLTAWKSEVAEATGVPAVALAGSTKEEIEAHAATLKPLISSEAPRKGAVGPYVPTEGSAPAGAIGGPAQTFADFIGAQLGR